MKTKIALAVGLMLSTSAMAHSSHGVNACDIELEHSVKVTPDYVQIMDGENTLYRITEDDKLMVSGKEVSLTPEQRAVIEDYREQMHQVVPEVVELIEQAFVFARQTLDKVFTELFGESSNLQPKVETMLASLEDKFSPYISGDNDEFLLSKEGIELAGEEFGDQFGDDMEQLMKESTGELLMMIGRMMSEGEGSMNSFQQRMEDFGEQIESDGERLEQQGEAVCLKMQRLEAVESEMQQKIPQLANFDLLKA